MDVERGTINTFLIPARNRTTHYLCVFQRVDDPTNYQYSIAASIGSNSGPLLLRIEEKDNAVAADSEVTLGVGDWFVEVYGQNSASNYDASLAVRFVHSELITVHSVTSTAPVYPPPPGSTTCSGVDILDSEGNIIAHVDDGDTYTVTEMAYIAAVYADYATALADTTTVPTASQAIKVTDTSRLYQGDGTRTSSALVADQQYLLPVREQGQRLLTTVDGTEVTIQINE